MGGGMDGTEHWMTFEQYDLMHYCQDCRTYVGPGTDGRCLCHDHDDDEEGDDDA